MQTWRATLWIDLSGVALVLGTAAALFGYAARPFRQSERMQELRDSIAGMEKDDVGLTARLDTERAQLVSLNAMLTEAGKLPEQAPVAAYQARLAELATGNRIRITSFAPLSDREYPGLLEKRFTFEARGETADMLRFLRAVEIDSSWADIGYLTLGRPTTPGQTADERSLAFVISLFSSPKKELPEPSGA